MNSKNINKVTSSEVVPNDEKDLRCSITKKFENGSCIPLYLLVEMAQAYNKYYTNDTIKLDSTLEILNPTSYKKYLLKQFKKKLMEVCNNQICWTKQDFINKMNKQLKEELQKNTFRPKGPDEQYEWLNTLHINNVMEQYSNKYKDFKYLGAVPIDFNDLPELGIKNLDFKKLMNEGKTKLGMVINTDEHYKPGAHWQSLYCDLNKGVCYFIDSYGMEPDKRIVKFMRRVARFIKNDLGKTPVLDYNRLQHQRGGTECGVFSISFILRLLRGDSFEEINNERVSDDQVNVCRNYYFT